MFKVIIALALIGACIAQDLNGQSWSYQAKKAHQPSTTHSRSRQLNAMPQQPMQQQRAAFDQFAAIQAPQQPMQRDMQRPQFGAVQQQQQQREVIDQDNGENQQQQRDIQQQQPQQFQQQQRVVDSAAAFEQQQQQRDVQQSQQRPQFAPASAMPQQIQQQQRIATQQPQQLLLQPQQQIQVQNQQAVQQQQQQRRVQVPQQQQQRLSPSVNLDTICQGRDENERIPHPTNPNLFVLCHASGASDVMSCPAGLVFNLNTLNCETSFKAPKACSSNPCQNRAACVDLPFFQFRCECASGFTGELCERQNSCAANSCGSNGVCISLAPGAPVSSYCVCQNGLSYGLNCDTSMESNPCLETEADNAFFGSKANPAVFVQCDGHVPHLRFCNYPLIWSARTSGCEWNVSA